jgi:hypothetical protein
MSYIYVMRGSHLAMLRSVDALLGDGTRNHPARSRGLARSLGCDPAGAPRSAAAHEVVFTWSYDTGSARMLQRRAPADSRSGANSRSGLVSGGSNNSCNAGSSRTAGNSTHSGEPATAPADVRLHKRRVRHGGKRPPAGQRRSAGSDVSMRAPRPSGRVAA